jgi:hypothetical protein
MLLAGLVTATVALITVRLMQAHAAATDWEPVPITHAADVLGHTIRDLIGHAPLSVGDDAAGRPHPPRRVDGKWVLKGWVQNFFPRFTISGYLGTL